MAGEDENPYTMPVRPDEAPKVPPAHQANRAGGGAPEPPPERPQRRSRMLPLLVAVLALAGFGAIVWYAYTWGTGEVPPEQLPVVTAERDLTNVKEKPEEPGGMEVPHQDADLLNQRSGADQADGDETVERLLPRPETPQPPEPAETQTTETATAETATAETATAETATAETATAETGPASASETDADTGPAEDLPSEPPAPPAISPPLEPLGEQESAGDPAAPQASVPEPSPETGAPEIPVSEPPGETVAEDQVQTPPPAEDETALDAPAADAAVEVAESPVVPPKPAPEAEPEMPAAEPAPATPTAAAATVQSGDWVLQLAALREQAAVEGEWQRLQAKHPDLLGGLALATQTVETGSGTFIRLQAGPLPNRATARDLCGLLQAQGTDCLAKRH